MMLAPDEFMKFGQSAYEATLERNVSMLKSCDAIAGKWTEYAAQSVAQYLSHLQKLAGAATPHEAAGLHMQFARRAYESSASGAASLGELYIDCLSKALTPPLAAPEVKDAADPARPAPVQRPKRR